MPIRRKACTACFRGRRKCDLAFPVCGRCRRNQRGCQYDSPPQTLEDVVSESISCAAGPPLISGATSADLDVWPADAALEIYLESSRLLSELVSPCTDAPNMVTQLGAVQSISENMESWKWVAKELQSYPKSYAQLAETVFIHNALVGDVVHWPLRVAFGVCAAYDVVNPKNRSMVVGTLDTEVSELLNSTPGGSLMEDLSKMQAMVLYHIIRLFDGDTKQRVLAEQQQGLVKAWGLQLLQRADTEPWETPPNWKNWILTESIRRTVMVAFMADAMHSVFKHGICPELPTLAILPLSTHQSFWSSQDAYLQHFHEEETIKYADFTGLWLSAPKEIDAFEKLILVACKGLRRVDAISHAAEDLGSFSSMTSDTVVVA